MKRIKKRHAIALSICFCFLLSTEVFSQQEKESVIQVADSTSNFESKIPFVLDTHSLTGATVNNNTITLDENNKENKITITNNSDGEILVDNKALAKKKTENEKTQYSSQTINVSENQKINIAGTEYTIKFPAPKADAFTLANISVEGGMLDVNEKKITIDSDSNKLIITNNYSTKIKIGENNVEVKTGESHTINLTKETTINIGGIDVNIIISPKSEVAENSMDSIQIFYKEKWEKIKGNEIYNFNDIDTLKIRNKSTKIFKVNINKDANPDTILTINSSRLLEYPLKKIISNGEKITVTLRESDSSVCKFTILVKKSSKTKMKFFLFLSTFLLVFAGLFFIYYKFFNKKRKPNKAIQQPIKHKSDLPITAQKPNVQQNSATKERERVEIEKLLFKNMLQGHIPAHLQNDYQTLYRRIEAAVQSNKRSSQSAMENSYQNKITELNRKIEIQNTENNKFQNVISDLKREKSNIETENRNNREKYEKEISTLKPFNNAIGNFINSLDFAYKQLRQIEIEADKSSKFYPMVREIIDGQGRRMSNPIFDVVRPYNTLLEVLKIDSMDKLKNVSTDVFFNTYINNYCERTLTQIAQLNAYSFAGYPLNLSAEIERQNIDGIKSIYANLSMAIQSLGYKMILPQLGIDEFDSSKHTKSNNSTLMHIMSEKIEAVPFGKIYDIARIGFETTTGQIITKTTVVCKL